MTDLRFDDKVVVVTGGGRGIGRGHALLLAAKGARVLVADNGAGIDGSPCATRPADAVVGEITQAGGRAVACSASVADEVGAQSVIDTAVEAFGRIDAVINNAGVHDPGLFETLSTDQIRGMLDVHYFGTLFVSRAAWPHLVEAGQGRIVNTVSEAMLGGIPELTSYGAAKGAVWGLTRTLATEGATHGIRVNAIAPRAYTRMSASQGQQLAQLYGMSEDTMAEINAGMPPELCAPAAAFLAHQSCSLNGEVLLTGMGGVSRLAVVRTQGIWKQSLTAEDIAENLDQIMNVDDAYVTEATRSVL
ncbi:short-chain dehydrogenase [Mycolicibacterium sp. GF69]|uniref:SDR family NAD(P)-dependent oxidoreductase n=1 Tax=Mycolicibacterium sp. GF69 TaxID=2267251 RepID=UPI000DCE6ADB|nr:SDR family NAD(P)-dependent oxidoreductase [Mycolicibacterium sp. GF69]RAV10355.1 short-chain dehydrogenase [Mycolicibacterium sp. GF69]